MIDPFGEEWIKDAEFSILANSNVEITLEKVQEGMAGMCKINLRFLLSQWPRLRYTFRYDSQKQILKLIIYHCPGHIAEQMRIMFHNLDADNMKKLLQKQGQ